MVRDIGVDQKRRGAAKQALAAEGDHGGPPLDGGGEVTGFLVDEGLDPRPGVGDHVGTNPAMIGPVKQPHGGAVIGDRRLHAPQLAVDIPDVLPRQEHPGSRLCGPAHRGQGDIRPIQVSVRVGEAQIAPGPLSHRP